MIASRVPVPSPPPTARRPEICNIKIIHMCTCIQIYLFMYIINQDPSELSHDSHPGSSPVFTTHFSPSLPHIRNLDRSARSSSNASSISIILQCTGGGGGQSSYTIPEGDIIEDSLFFVFLGCIACGGTEEFWVTPSSSSIILQYSGERGQSSSGSPEGGIIEVS